MWYKFKHPDFLVYSTVLVSSVLYCVFWYIVSCLKYFENFQDDYDDLGEGFFARKRDKSDIEWETISYLTWTYFPGVILYVLLIEVIKYKNLHYKVHQICQIMFILIYFHFQGVLSFFVILFLQPIFFYLVRFFRKTNFSTWLCSCISLLVITIYKKYVLFSEYPTSNEYQIYLLSVSMSWINLKCTSFYLENPKSEDLLNLVSYCFYPPTFFTGPFISYEDFKNVYASTNKNHNKTKKLAKNLIWCLLWYIFGNFCLHFVYVNATSFQPQFVEKLDYVSLCGYGYVMGQFFHIKYLIQYGLSTALASFENANVPHLPRCIGRIHLYSDMWRYFDPGLYTFLKRHIYFPMVQKFHYRLVASFLCFCFVCVWHGPEDFIIIWTVMNYIGIVIEYISTYTSKKHLKDISNTLGPTVMNVINNIFAAPLLAFSAISNFYFFGGKDIGDIFSRRLFGNLFDSFRLLLIFYCCCQVSTNLRSMPARKM